MNMKRLKIIPDKIQRPVKIILTGRVIISFQLLLGLPSFRQLCGHHSNRKKGTRGVEA